LPTEEMPLESMPAPNLMPQGGGALDGSTPWDPTPPGYEGLLNTSGANHCFRSRSGTLWIRIERASLYPDPDTYRQYGYRIQDSQNVVQYEKI